MATKTRKLTLASNVALFAAFFGSMIVINILDIDLLKTPLAGIGFEVLASATYAFYNVYADVKLKDFNQ